MTEGSLPPARPELQSRAERFADLSNDLLGATDTRGRLTWTNPAWARTLGWSAEELAGRPYPELLHPGDRRGAATLERRLRKATGIAEEIELRVRARDGHHRWIRFSVSVPPDEAAVYLCGRDVTEERRALAELASTTARYRGVVANLPGAIVALFDANLRLTLVDGPQLERRGFSPDAFLGRRLPSVLAAGRATDLLEHFDVVLEGSPRSFDYRSLDGSTEYRVHLLPLDVPGGEVAGMGLMLDVTAERRTARELQRSNEELEAFAYAASHDLLSPLRSVTGFVQLLRRRYRGRLDDEADEIIDHAVEGTVRMRALIDDLLAYARVGRELRPPEPVVLGELAARAAAEAAQGADLPPRIELGALPTVPGDARALEQLLFNLLANAVKYVTPGEAADVAVAAERLPDAWRITVADRGIGIEPAHAGRVFRMFHRLHAADAYPGTGIGLSIAAKVVEQHGGEIGVEPHPGGGSRFWFTLPDAGVNTTRGEPGTGSTPSV
ncbi:MAG: sensor histidine kinase [Solirubrobacteraceae bacterium]